MSNIVELVGEARRRLSTVDAVELGEMPLGGVRDQLLVFVEVARTLVAAEELLARGRLVDLLWLLPRLVEEVGSNVAMEVELLSELLAACVALVVVVVVLLLPALAQWWRCKCWRCWWRGWQ